MRGLFYGDLESLGCAGCFGTGFFDGVGSGENHAHAAVSFDFGFAEDADLCAGFFKHFLKIVEFDLCCVALLLIGFDFQLLVLVFLVILVLKILLDFFLLSPINLYQFL